MEGLRASAPSRPWLVFWRLRKSPLQVSNPTNRLRQPIDEPCADRIYGRILERHEERGRQKKTLLAGQTYSERWLSAFGGVTRLDTVRR